MYMMIFKKSHKIFSLFSASSGLPESSKSEKEDPEPDTNSSMLEDCVEPCQVDREAQRLRLSCLNNLAACHFQWGHHHTVIQLSSAVLDINTDMVKALYRSVNSMLCYF